LAAISDLLSSLWHFIDSGNSDIPVGCLVEAQLIEVPKHGDRIRGLDEFADGCLLELCPISFLVAFTLSFLDFWLENLLKFSLFPTNREKQALERHTLASLLSLGRASSSKTDRGSRNLGSIFLGALNPRQTTKISAEMFLGQHQ